MAIGGMVTILNNSSEAVWAGDWLAWTFFSEDGMQPNTGIKRAKKNPRRIGIELAGEPSLAATRQTHSLTYFYRDALAPTTARSVRVVVCRPAQRQDDRAVSLRPNPL
jgi:hypothetical protein